MDIPYQERSLEQRLLLKKVLLKSRFEDLFRNIRDFPIQDFVFPDITPLLERDPDLFRVIIDSMVSMYEKHAIDKVVCIESFGYVFGAPVAYRLGAGIVLARRAGKLPRDKVSQEYSMIYSKEKVMEMQIDSCSYNDRVILVDDFLATGGTAEAALKLLEQLDLNIQVIGFSSVVEVAGAGGRELLKGKCPNITSLINMKLNEKQWKVIDVNESIVRELRLQAFV